MGWTRYFCIRSCFLPLNRISDFFKLGIIEQILILVIVISTLLPLRCSIGKGYDYLKLSEVESDLVTCKLTRKPQNKVEKCPLLPESLDSFRHVMIINMTVLSSMASNLNIQPGGRWFPSHCNTWQRVAIIIPYRNREAQLQLFLQHMHPFLQAQMLDYGIFVIEQSDRHEFNRGKLFNIGFQEALKEPDFCCFIFHDVDLLPESPQHIYGCSKQPRHMCSALDTFRYVLPYPELFGGAVAFTKSQFELINGYSNMYFGWGGEDDDLADRLLEKQMSIRRWDSQISRYTMLFHKKESPNPERLKLLKYGKQRLAIDGLNNLNYKVMDYKLKPLYTWLLVDVDP